MIELHHDQLVFSFPAVHPDATLRVEFQRTLRIPDDGRDYPLPPGLGRFPLRHVDDFAPRVPARWIEHGGVMLPMYQSEALWIRFDADYPFAVQVAAGKIDAVTGQPLSADLHDDPQNYLAVPDQPWLDGFCVEDGVIRQFVAMPLGSGYSAEEQLTGTAAHGGLQLIAHPIQRAVYERTRRHRPRFFDAPLMDVCSSPQDTGEFLGVSEQGLAPGGRMEQEIYDDPYGLADWDQAQTARCYVHLANSLTWRQITGHEPPTVPPTATEYANARLPWFEYYDDRLTAVSGSKTLAGLKSVATMGKEKGDQPLPENASVPATPVIELRKGLRKEQVREGAF